MSTQKTFNMCYGINLHFTNKSYSVIKYGTNTTPAHNAYNQLSPAQKFRFSWLYEKFPNTQDLVYACIGCQLDDVNIQYGTKEEIKDAYLKFKGRRESLTYSLKNDRSRHETSGFITTDKLFFKYLVGEYIPEYVILASHGTQDLEILYESPNFSWAKDKILKLMKYRDFFNVNKYLPIIK